MKKLLLSAVLVLSFLISGYTRSWTLQDCINYALENNVQIKRQELVAKTAQIDYDQAKYQLLPNLNAGYDHSFSSGRSLNTDTYNWVNQKNQDGSIGARSEVNLFEGLKNYYSIQKNRIDLLSSMAEEDKVKNDISLLVATCYLQILLNQELLEVAKSQIEVTLLQQSRMEKMVETGTKAKGDLLNLQAQGANEKLNVTNASNQLKISYLTLVQLLELDTLEGFEIVKPEFTDPGTYFLDPVDSIYAVSLEKLPQIKSAKFQTESAEKDLLISRSGLYPSLSLTGLYYTRYNKSGINPLDPNPLNPTMDYPYIDQIKDNRYGSLSLSLNVPIFNRNYVNTNISKSKIAVKDADYRYYQVCQELYKQIQQAHADAIASLEQYNSAKEAVSFNEEAFKYTEQKFSVGLLSTVDFNEGKKNLTKARSELIQAKFEYIFKTKILDFYKGLPLSI